jgi:hypothetical protein
MEFFGEPWPSGVCEGGTQIATPVGKFCLLCEESIEKSHQGSFMFDVTGAVCPVHRECSLRSVVGGIGHLEDHHRWCQHEHDPDGGRTYRQSALEVWQWVMQHGIA